MPSDATSSRFTLRLAVQRVVIPLVVVSAITAGSLRTLSSAAIPDNNYTACQTYLISQDRDASDVVAFGSSRTGAAIDVVLLAETLGGGATAEKVVYTQGSELDRDLALRTYVSNRGVPSVVALELSFERRPERLVDAADLITPSERSMAHFSSAVYSDFVRSELSSGRHDISDMLVRSSMWSPPRFLFGRLDLGWGLASRNPKLAISPSDTCAWKFRPRPGRWTVGDARRFDATAPSPRPAQVAKWERSVARYRSFDPSDPWTAQELAVLDDMVEAALDAGVETVVLYYLPTFREPANSIDLGYISARYPDTVIFDARRVLDDPTRPGLAYQHRDANHLNLYGAGEVTVALADLVAEQTPSP